MQKALLDWYGRHARVLPWRVGPAERAAGRRPDPYRVWLSEVMLQQTTVAAVGGPDGHYQRFTERWPTVEALAAAPLEAVLEAWAGLGYYARARNLHACARRVSTEFAGRFPKDEADLLSLPGVGPYTAAAVAAIAFGRPAVVMDGNIERVMARLFAERDPMPGVKPKLKAHAAALTPSERPGEHAEALMDLGATICTPRSPACGICPLMADCRARTEGIAAELPTKARKAAKPVRFGLAYAALDRDGLLHVVRRPPRGLLGGMLALPSTDWVETAPAPAAPFAAGWEDVGEVRHTFTHFHLRLTVFRAYVDALQGDARPARDAVAAMPTVFAKAVRLVL